MGYETKPVRCRSCKNDPERVAALSKLPCYKFQSGTCTAGDSCKFSHDPVTCSEPKTVAHVTLSGLDAIGDDDEDDEEDWEVAGVLPLSAGLRAGQPGTFTWDTRNSNT